MTRNKVLIAWLALIGLAILLLIPREPSGIVPFKSTGKTMGTTYNVVLYADAEIIRSHAIDELISEELIRVNQLMSTYIPDSELSQLNQLPAGHSMVMSSDNVKILNESKRLFDASQGAFDVTVGPLVNLWGFGPDGRVVKQPSDEEIARVRPFVGMDLLTLDGDRVTKQHDDLYVDFSAIAKGYGVDQIAEILEGLGIRDYMVEIGGEMRLSGKKPQGDNWRIAIEKPLAESREVEIVIEPINLAVATSGDYRNYFEVDGVRYSHTINPLTGKPITHNLVSVTVLHESSMTADALATMFSVIGPERALDYAEASNLVIYMIVKTPNGFKRIMSTSFISLFPNIKG